MMRAGAATLGIVLAVSNAFAQSPDVVKADTLFREGRAAMKAGDLQTACPKLEQSYRLDPAAGTAVNLGDCFDKQGKIGSALFAYQAARKLLKPGDPRVAPVDQQIADLEKRVPKLTITLAPDAPEGTTVERDGRAVDVADLGRPMPVNPGEITLVVSAPGHERFRKRLTLAERQTRTFVAEPGDPTGQPPRPSPYPPTRKRPRDTDHDAPPEIGSSSSKTIGLVLGGVGVVALGTGIATGAMADAKKKTVDENCDENKLCNDQGYDAARSGKTLTTVSYVGWGIGLVGIAAGGYFLLFADSSKETTTSVSVNASDNRGRVTIRGRF